LAMAESTVLRTSEGFALRGSVVKQPGSRCTEPLREIPMTRTPGARRTSFRHAARSSAPRSAKHITGLSPAGGGEAERPTPPAGSARTAYLRLKGSARRAAWECSKYQISARDGMREGTECCGVLSLRAHRLSQHIGIIWPRPEGQKAAGVVKGCNYLHHWLLLSQNGFASLKPSRHKT